jgi:hypothetical protein
VPGPDDPQLRLAARIDARRLQHRGHERQHHCQGGGNVATHARPFTPDEPSTGATEG